MQAPLNPAGGAATHTDARWWAIGRDATLQIRHWGDEFVVFNPRSGHTHFLDVAAGSLLQWLVEQPLHEDDLARLMAAQLGLPADGSVQAPLRLLLEQLDEQGLVDAC